MAEKRRNRNCGRSWRKRSRNGRFRTRSFSWRRFRGRPWGSSRRRNCASSSRDGSGSEEAEQDELSRASAEGGAALVHRGDEFGAIAAPGFLVVLVITHHNPRGALLQGGEEGRASVLFRGDFNGLTGAVANDDAVASSGGEEVGKVADDFWIDPDEIPHLGEAHVEHRGVEEPVAREPQRLQFFVFALHAQFRVELNLRA